MSGLPEGVEEALEESEALLLEPRSEYDSRVTGVGYRFNIGPGAVYDIARVLAVLETEGMTPEEAVEYYEFNILGGWNGERTPIYIHQIQKPPP